MKPVQVELIGCGPSPEHVAIARFYPEIAFAGRSNVGKSSLLNTLVRRKKLAAISSKPGKTRLMCFYLVDNRFVFVDLPGFGYAKVSKETRWLWSRRIEQYLLHRSRLRLVCYLVDSRHDPTRIDLGMLEWLELHQKPFVVVLTKVDKLSAQHRAERQQQIEHLVQHCQFVRGIVLYSSKTGEGRQMLWRIIQEQAQNGEHNE